MNTSQEFNIRRLRTPNGWYTILQLDDLQSVCEHLYQRSDVRYARDFFPPQVRLPFMLKDSPTEDAAVRMLQVITFEQAQQVVSYDPDFEPKGLISRKTPEDLPSWIWSSKPWPHIDSDGYRQVCLGNAFFCASEDDKPTLEKWFSLRRSRSRLVYPLEYENTRMPFLIKISRVNDDYSIVTTITTEDLIVLVRNWSSYLGARQIPHGEWPKFSERICRFIDNLIRAEWPVNSKTMRGTINTI
jgi:hypothetical protein